MSSGEHFDSEQCKSIHGNILMRFEKLCVPNFPQKIFFYEHNVSEVIIYRSMIVVSYQLAPSVTDVAVSGSHIFLTLFCQSSKVAVLLCTLYSVIERWYQFLNSHIKTPLFWYWKQVAKELKIIWQTVKKNVNIQNDGNIQALQIGTLFFFFNKPGQTTNQAEMLILMY